MASTTYNIEPPPTAKALLKTDCGDLQLELFAKQTPLASRAFLQGILDGAYTNRTFHRLVPGFIIQAGDPTGQSFADTEPFGDEFSNRLKFNRRGLLGMAKGEDGKYDGSQFFFTLAPTPELDRQMTLFGRIEGDTIFNLMRMAEGELVEGTERPLYPVKITGTEILVNPFEGMVARVREAPRTREVEAKTAPKKRKKPAGKNVLSFGGEEGEEEAAPIVKKVKANPKLVSAGEEQPELLNTPSVASAEPAPRRQRRRSSPTADEVEVPARKAVPLPVQKPSDDMASEDEDDSAAIAKQTALDRTNAEIAALKASMKRTVNVAPKSKEKPKSALEAMMPETATRGRKRGKASDERGALDLFKSFKQRLEDLPPDQTSETKVSEPSSNGAPAPGAVQEDNEEAALCDLHFIANCQSCRDWGAEAEDEEDEGGTDWMTHRLQFARDTRAERLEWNKALGQLDVIDPREKARALKEETRSKGKGGKE